MFVSKHTRTHRVGLSLVNILLVSVLIKEGSGGWKAEMNPSPFVLSEQKQRCIMHILFSLQLCKDVLVIG